LHEGQRGACFVRQMVDGAMQLTTYGRSSGFCIDPIEKKPLNHFLPGTPVLSFGTAGVTLGSTERLRNLAKQNPLVQARFMGRWSESKPCKRRYLDHEQCWGLVGSYEVIPPQAIVTDARVSQVFLAKGTGEPLIAGNASPAGAEPKLETPAVGLRP
jgi:hypothetical protein